MPGRSKYDRQWCAAERERVFEDLKKSFHDSKCEGVRGRFVVIIERENGVKMKAFGPASYSDCLSAANKERTAEFGMGPFAGHVTIRKKRLWEKERKK